MCECECVYMYVYVCVCTSRICDFLWVGVWLVAATGVQYTRPRERQDNMGQVIAFNSCRLPCHESERAAVASVVFRRGFESSVVGERLQ